MFDTILQLQRTLHEGLAGGLKSVATFEMPALFVALASAFVFGALHALMPGHGKSTLVAYHARRPSAVTEGLVTSSLLIATHVGSAMILVAVGATVVDAAAFGREPSRLNARTVSAILISVLGVWLLIGSLRRSAHVHQGSGRVLAVMTGLVPCPLTTFVMTYAAAKGALAAGLIVSTAMALGMIATVAAFAMSAVMARTYLFPWLARSERWRAGIGRGLEIAGAAGVIALGLAML